MPDWLQQPIELSHESASTVWGTMAAVERIVPVALVLFATVACGSKAIDYQPSPTTDPAIARQILVRAIETQPEGETPAEVRALDDKLEVVVHRTRRSPWLSGLTSTPERTVLYYEDLGRIHLSKGARYFVALIWDRNGAYKLRVTFREESGARAFLDALASLKDAAATREGE